MKAMDIIMLPVKDRQKAKEFYLQLGFTVIVEAADAHGEPWIQLGLPNGGTTISLSGFPGVIYETDDIESEINGLKAKGIKVGNVDEQPYGKFAWLEDLDGNRICLRQK